MILIYYPTCLYGLMKWSRKQQCEYSEHSPLFHCLTLVMPKKLKTIIIIEIHNYNNHYNVLYVSTKEFESQKNQLTCKKDNLP